MARRSAQPRELVRLTPLQFSLSVSIVVLLAAGSGLAGYIYGHKKALEEPEVVLSTSAGDQGIIAPGDGAGMESQAAVTFYSTLTEPRAETAVKPDPPSPRAPVALPVPPPATAHSAGGGSMMLQVASYGKRETASALLESLAGEGYSGTVVKADLGDRGVWYRVRIGPYTGENEAGRILEKLREERNLKGFIVK